MNKPKVFLAIEKKIKLTKGILIRPKYSNTPFSIITFQTLFWPGNLNLNQNES
jgi:hypothetical protein